MDLLKMWNRTQYINYDILKLFKMIFKWEEDRATIEQIEKCSWLNGSKKQKKTINKMY